MDIKKTIDKVLRPQEKTNEINISELTRDFQRLSPIRNRVCHTRPLEFEDVSTCFDVAKELLKFRSIQFNSLRRNISLLEKNPIYALQFKIPPFWFSDDDINHNLPQTEFEETGFIGRRNDRREMRNLLKAHRNIINIVGEGGVGKTALALRCLYDLLDDPERPFEVIVWVSLKSQTLTATGIMDIRNAITDTLGLLRSVAAELGNPSSGRLDVTSLISEISDSLSSTNVLVAIDNLETLIGDSILLDLLQKIPNNSKILITSRIGLGQLELPYRLDPMNQNEAVGLMRSFAKILSENAIIGNAKYEILAEYCNKLFNNPLFIKWFVESVARGANPQSLLQPEMDQLQSALEFCCSNILDSLNSDEKKIITILAAARDPLSLIQLAHLCSDDDLPGNIDYALSLLHNSCLVKRGTLPSGDYVYRLSDPIDSYVSANSPPSPTVFREIRKKLSNLRNRARGDYVKQLKYQFDVFSIRANNPDEYVIASYLRRALSESEKGNIENARKQMDMAKNLKLSHAESYRIGGLVECNANANYRADREFMRAVEHDPQSPIVRYTICSVSYPRA